MLRILGIDPGSRVCGFALIEGKKPRPMHVSDFRLLDLGILKANVELSFPERIGLLHEKLYHLIGELSPSHIAIEDSFCGNNPKSALKLGQARGALISAIQRHRIPMSEYSPTHVKSSVGGRGGASKEEISKYLSRQFLRDFSNVPWDATDALAIAIAGGVAGMKMPLTHQNNRKIEPSI